MCNSSAPRDAPFFVTAFTAVCSELGIEVRTAAGNEGIIEELQKAKYEGIVVDFDIAPDPTLMLNALRRHLSNRNVVAFAVATKADDRQQALENGMNPVPSPLRCDRDPASLAWGS